MPIKLTNVALLRVSVVAVAALATIAAPTPAHAEPLPLQPWCQVPNPFGVLPPGCQPPGPRAEPAPTPTQPAPTPTAAPRPPQDPVPTPTPRYSKVTFEVFGPGGAHVITTEPPTEPVGPVALPWSRTITVTPDVVVVVKARANDAPNPGCRIIVDGKVMAEVPYGSEGFCLFKRS